MRYLKLFESFEEIDSICKKYNITDYTINGDGSIDVNGSVYLMSLALTELPLKFRNVSGSFMINENCLTSLKGCPESVGSDFNCNQQFHKDREKGPQKRIFTALTSLEGCPKYVGGSFACTYNGIRTLEILPSTVGYTWIHTNPVYELWRLFHSDHDRTDSSIIELFNDFGITDGEVVILDRLNEFLEMTRRPILTNTNGLEREGYKII